MSPIPFLQDLKKNFHLISQDIEKELKTHSPGSLKIELESTKFSLALILLNNSKHTRSCYREELQESVCPNVFFDLISQKKWGTNWDPEIFCKIISSSFSVQKLGKGITGRNVLVNCLLTNTSHQRASQMLSTAQNKQEDLEKPLLLINDYVGV